MPSSASIHALLARDSKIRYCDRCGAQIEGKGAWGHDDNCPKKKG